jgi:hypothetical protein
MRVFAFPTRESIDSVQTERAAREKILFERCRDSSRRRIAPRGVVSRPPFRGVYFLAPRNRSTIDVFKPGGDRIQRHDRRVVNAALNSTHDIVMNSRPRRERGLRDAELLASPSNLRADAG